MMDKTRADLEAKWQAVLHREMRKCGHALIALARCRQQYPELWQALNKPAEKQMGLFDNEPE